MEAALVERLTIALEALATRNPAQSRAVGIMKEIAYIKEYNGDQEELTQFLTVVQIHLDSVDNNTRQELWQAIFNTKIQGPAKELLINNQPEGWEEAKLLLKQHFRPTVSYKDISRRISNLKVSSISDLNQQVEKLIKEVNTFATYEIKSVETKNCFYTVLVDKIKQIVAGNLSRDIRDKFILHEIKEILYSYIGFDYNNLDRKFVVDDRHPTQKHKNNNRHDTSNPTQNNKSNNPNPNNQTRNTNNYKDNSGQYRQRSSDTQQNNSGQHRQNNYRPNQNTGQNRQPIYLIVQVNSEMRNKTCNLWR